MAKAWLFDRQWTKDFTEVRQKFMAEFVGHVRAQLELKSALDLGCGVGYFSKFLSDTGFHVVAIDGREENANEGRRRYPEITFLARNVEDVTLPEMGAFDFVVCIGLLYHLENPFRAIRNLNALTGKVLLIETMCAPGPDPSMELLDEGTGEDQGLNHVAFYPSESCLIKMLYRAGFPFVYRFTNLPEDELFTGNIWRKKQRTFLAASKLALSAPNLTSAKETFRLAGGDLDPWATILAKCRGYCRTKMQAVAARLVRPMLGRIASMRSKTLGAKPK